MTITKTNPKIYQLDGWNRVAVKLYSMTTTTDVYWSPRRYVTETRPDGTTYQEQRGGCNSYVLVYDERGACRAPDGTRCSLVSVNGGGEVRWVIEAWDLRAMLDGRPSSLAEALGAFQHFRLTLREEA